MDSRDLAGDVSPRHQFDLQPPRGAVEDEVAPLAIQHRSDDDLVRRPGVDDERLAPRQAMAAVHGLGHDPSPGRLAAAVRVGDGQRQGEPPPDHAAQQLRLLRLGAGGENGPHPRQRAKQRRRRQGAAHLAGDHDQIDIVEAQATVGLRHDHARPAHVDDLLP